MNKLHVDSCVESCMMHEKSAHVFCRPSIEISLMHQNYHRMSKIKRPFTMQEIAPWKHSLLFLFLLWLVGCSAFHEVSVVDHGDEEGAVKDAVLEPTRVSPPPPIVSASNSFQSEQIEKPPISAVAPSVSPIPAIPPMAPSSGKISVEPTSRAQSAEDSTLPWALEDVFFDFDQFEIRRDAIPLLEQDAKVLLKRYANREVVIQGHCDERGTEEYNFILGERRARAVKNYLVDLGVEASQLRVLSLGKTKPFCLQRTISCFQQNRRAHFVLN